MDIKQTENKELPDERLQPETVSSAKEESRNIIEKADNATEKKDRNQRTGQDKDSKVLSVGEWMLVIFVYLIPVVNIIVTAIWAFSSNGNVHRRNLSRALLLWVIILLVAYVVAMTVAGFTIMDLFRQ